MEFEIFKTGTHTSDLGITKNYSLDDLNFIAQSYDPKIHEAPIVVGHPKHDSPAMGWIESLKVVGNNLVASSKQIIPEFLDALKKGLYKKRSVSLDKDGKLRHVGFLGGAVPAVKGLANVQFSEGDFSTFEFDDDSNSYSETDNKKDNEISSTDSQLHTNQLSGILENLISLNQHFSNTSAYKEDIQKISASISDLSNNIQKNDFDRMLNDKMLSGSLTPAMKDKILELSNYLQTQNFSEIDSKSFQKEVSNLITAFVNSIPKFLNLQNFAEKEESSNSVKDEFQNLTLDEQSASIHKEALNLIQKEKISYVSAVNKILTNKNK